MHANKTKKRHTDSIRTGRSRRRSIGRVRIRIQYGFDCVVDKKETKKKVYCKVTASVIVANTIYSSSSSYSACWFRWFLLSSSSSSSVFDSMLIPFVPCPFFLLCFYLRFLLPLLRSCLDSILILRRPPSFVSYLQYGSDYIPALWRGIRKRLLQKHSSMIDRRWTYRELIGSERTFFADRSSHFT